MKKQFFQQKNIQTALICVPFKTWWKWAREVRERKKRKRSWTNKSKEKRRKKRERKNAEGEKERKIVKKGTLHAAKTPPEIKTDSPKLHPPLKQIGNITTLKTISSATGAIIRFLNVLNPSSPVEEKKFKTEKEKKTPEQNKRRKNEKKWSQDERNSFKK